MTNLKKLRAKIEARRNELINIGMEALKGKYGIEDCAEWAGWWNCINFMLSEIRKIEDAQEKRADKFLKKVEKNEEPFSAEKRSRKIEVYCELYKKNMPFSAECIKCSLKCKYRDKNGLKKSRGRKREQKN